MSNIYAVDRMRACNGLSHNYGENVQLNFLVMHDNKFIRNYIYWEESNTFISLNSSFESWF